MHVTKDDLYIPKGQLAVTVWTEGEGRVGGTIFLSEYAEGHRGEETPLDLLNGEDAFVVMQPDWDAPPRFIAKRRILRLIYDDPQGAPNPEDTHHPCQIRLVDGAHVEGSIHEPLRPEHCRLFDYLNSVGGRFIRVYLEGDEVCLVNVSHIAHVTEGKPRR